MAEEQPTATEEQKYANALNRFACPFCNAKNWLCFPKYVGVPIIAEKTANGKLCVDNVIETPFLRRFQCKLCGFTPLFDMSSTFNISPK
jgi:hypothetical protein